MLHGDISARQEPAQTYPVLITSFEDQSWTPWSGTPSEFEFYTGWASDGSVSIRRDDATDGEFRMYSFPGDGLNYYPSAGERIEIDFFNDYAAGYCIFWFAVKSQLGRYYVWPFPNNDQWEIGKTGTAQASESLTGWTNGAVYTIVIEWGTDGTISAWIENADGSQFSSVLSFTDTQFTTGGIGFQGNNYLQAYDYARVTGTV